MNFFNMGAALGLFACALPAFAATENFDFAAPSVLNASSAEFYSMPGGAKVTVTGREYTVGSGGVFVAGDAIDVENNAWGLISDQGSFDRHTIDSWGGDEAMIFSFETAVSLLSVSISWFEGTGFYELFAGNSLGGLSLIGNTKDGFAYPVGDYSVFAIGAYDYDQTYQTIENYFSQSSCLQGEVQLKKWSIWGQTHYKCERRVTNTRTHNSGIKIKGLSIEITDPPQVPLPATGLLLMGGLIGLRMLRSRKA